MSYGVIPSGTSLLDGSARLQRHPPLQGSRAERERLLPPSTTSSPGEDAFTYGHHPHRPGSAGGSSGSGRHMGGPGMGPPIPPHHDPSAKYSKYESLDYEEYENTVYRADQAQGSSVDSLLYSTNKYLVCFAIGVITALAAFAVNLAVENISAAKFGATLTLLERGSMAGSFLAYAAMNAALVAGSVLVTQYVGPAAAGSGIADVKAYLNGVDVPYIFHLNTLVAKVVGAVGSVAGGLAIGKEGPFVHAGAAIAAIISQGGSGAMRLPIMRHFWNDGDRSDMVACGAAAGVAAAFRSPVGGVLFALEEMTSWWRSQMLWLAFFTTAVVSVCIRVLMKACGAHGCGFFGSGGFIYFEISEGQDNYEFYELLPMLLLGVLGGLLGSGFIVLNARLSELRKKHLTRYGRRGQLLEALAISLLTSTLSFAVPLIVQCQVCPTDTEGPCPRTDNMHSGNFVGFQCKPSRLSGRPEYNDLATLFFNTQDDAIRNLFSSKTKREYTVSSLLIFTTIFYGLAALTYGITAPTGLFVPSILCGAAYGRLVGIFVADMHPGHYIDEGTYALLGAASFLGGAMRLTVCTCVLLLELTNNLALLPLIMLVLLVAKAVGDGTGVRPIYEVAMHTKGLPFLQPAPEAFMRHLTAKECCGKPPVTFNRVEKVRTLVEALRSNRHNGFPVMARGPEGEQLICGIVLRQQLLTLLATGRSLQPTPAFSDASSRAVLTYSLPEFSKPMSNPMGAPDEGVLAPGALRQEALEQYLDLGPFVNPSYYVVQEDTSLSKVYQLLRTLGLRHVAVIPKAPEVVGIITRADLLPDAVEARLQGMPGHYGTDGLSLSAHSGNHYAGGSYTGGGQYGSSGSSLHGGSAGPAGLGVSPQQQQAQARAGSLQRSRSSESLGGSGALRPADSPPRKGGRGAAGAGAKAHPPAATATAQAAAAALPPGGTRTGSEGRPSAKLGYLASEGAGAASVSDRGVQMSAMGGGNGDATRGHGQARPSSLGGSGNEKLVVGGGSGLQGQAAHPAPAGDGASALVGGASSGPAAGLVSRRSAVATQRAPDLSPPLASVRRPLQLGPAAPAGAGSSGSGGAAVPGSSPSYGGLGAPGTAGDRLGP